jgi:hypothetical protein
VGGGKGRWFVVRCERWGGGGGGGGQAVLQLKRYWEVGPWLVPSQTVGDFIPVNVHTLFSTTSITPHPRRIPQAEKRISTGNKRTWTELTTGARSTETILMLHNRYPSFWIMMMLPEWHTHWGTRVSHILPYRGVRHAVTNLWRSWYAGILTYAPCFFLMLLC